MFILLDIDGVMLPAKSWQKPELLQDGFPVFASGAVQVLQEILTEADTIVLTTSHRSRFNVEQWKSIFRNRGIEVSKLLCTDSNTQLRSRREEVIHWLVSRPSGENFIIIDDDKSLNDLPAAFKERLLLTSPMIGLNVQHMQSLRELLHHVILNP